MKQEWEGGSVWLALWPIGLLTTVALAAIAVSFASVHPDGDNVVYEDADSVCTRNGNEVTCKRLDGTAYCTYEHAYQRTIHDCESNSKDPTMEGGEP